MWCGFPQWLNVKYQKRAEGAWPAIPNCDMCSPDPATRVTEFQVPNFHQINWTTKSGCGLHGNWNPVLTVNTDECGGGMKSGNIAKGLRTCLLSNVQLGRAEQTSPKANDGYYWLRVTLAAAAGYPVRILWEGRKGPGPKPEGTYTLDPLLSYINLRPGLTPTTQTVTATRVPR